MVSIEFEFSHETGSFRDAIVLPENHGLSDAQLEAMKVQRFENWKQAITSSDEPQGD